MVAADILEELADRTTGGHWRIGGLLASRPEVIAEWPEGATEHVAEARAKQPRRVDHRQKAVFLSRKPAVLR